MSKKPSETAIAVGAVIVSHGRVLLLQRSATDDVLPGLWELPSGKREPFEEMDGALEREVEEETGLMIRVLRWLPPFTYAVDKPDSVRDTVQTNVLAEPVDDAVDVVLSDEHQDYEWVPFDGLDGYALSDETREVIEEARAALAE